MDILSNPPAEVSYPTSLILLLQFKLIQSTSFIVLLYNALSNSLIPNAKFPIDCVLKMFMGETNKVLCFVSLRVDLPTVWHDLGCWGLGGIDKLHFLYINVNALRVL